MRRCCGFVFRSRWPIACITYTRPNGPMHINHLTLMSRHASAGRLKVDDVATSCSLDKCAALPWIDTMLLAVFAAQAWPNSSFPFRTYF